MSAHVFAAVQTVDVLQEKELRLRVPLEEVDLIMESEAGTAEAMQ